MRVFVFVCVHVCDCGVWVGSVGEYIVCVLLLGDMVGGSWWVIHVGVYVWVIYVGIYMCG